VLTYELQTGHISTCSYYHGNKSIHMTRMQSSCYVEVEIGRGPRIVPTRSEDALVSLQVNQI